MHIGDSSRTKLHNNQLAEGPQIDMDSPRPHYIAHRGKSYQKSPMIPHRDDKDPWGKYDVTFVQDNHSYLLMVDDAARCRTDEFLETEDQAAQKS